MCATLDMASTSVPRRGGHNGTRAACRDRDRKCAASRPGPNCPGGGFTVRAPWHSAGPV